VAPPQSSADKASATITLATPVQMAELNRLRFNVKEIAQMDVIARVSKDRRVQVREADNYGKKEEVTSYAAQMGQSVFPPIIMTLDDYLADGNTRVEAAKVRGDRFLPALVIQENYATADPRRKLEFHMLAATLNNQNGRRQTSKEARKTLVDALKLGWRVEQIVRALGTKATEVTKVKWEVDARDRLEKVGMQNGQVRATGTSLRALGKPVVLALNFEPYRALASLAMDAGLNASEILTIAKEAKATGSDQAALDHIAQVRLENDERILNYTMLEGPSKPPVARQLRQRLGFITKFAASPGVLVETNAPSMLQHQTALDASISILSAVRDLQAERISLTEGINLNGDATPDGDDTDDEGDEGTEDN